MSTCNDCIIAVIFFFLGKELFIESKNTFCFDNLSCIFVVFYLTDIFSRTIGVLLAEIFGVLDNSAGFVYGVLPVRFCL
jgi:hypothetical protein